MKSNRKVVMALSVVSLSFVSFMHMPNVIVVGNDNPKRNVNISSELIGEEGLYAEFSMGNFKYDDSGIADIGSADVTEEIVVGEATLALYPTFEDKEKAIESIKEICGKVLGVMKAKYDLDEFSKDSWENYYDQIDSFISESGITESDYQIIKLREFFDIYENYEVNESLISIAKTDESIDTLLSDEEFLLNLPVDTFEDVKEEIIGGNGNIARTSFSWGGLFDELSNINKPSLLNTAYSSSKAISYAESYAASPNPYYGYITGNDCTNFVSQIMVYGGTNMTQNWMTYAGATGWQYTVAWSYANSFANYWGVDFSYKSHKNFSAKLTSGDYIAIDYAADGSWNHMGFVTNKLSSYNSSLGYTDYKVAQHSSNYCAWTSSKTNGWESYSNCRYGIIRR